MSAITKGIFIVGAKRTAFGKFGGALKDLKASQLQTEAARAAIAESGLRPDQIDTVNIGNVLVATSADGGFVPRHTLLNCGIPIDRPALGISRLCGSGFQSVVNGALRTAFGTYGGAFKNVKGSELQVTAARAAIAASGLKPEQIDSVNIGNVLMSSQTDGGFLPRHVSLTVGVPVDRPALGVNRLCGSGFQAVVNGAQDILVGAAKVSLTGGVDNMSQSPYMVRGVRFGIPLGTNPPLEDSLWSGLFDTYCQTPMALTAENLATQYNIPREEVDRFALASQTNWKKAQDSGAFKAEIAPIKLKVKGKEVEFAVDEHPRPQTTLESLAKLPTVFKKDGTVTAGNASGICDGAAAVIVASEEAVKEYNLTPLARLVAYSAVGCEPKIMGIGPVPAIQNVLKLTGLSLNDIDLVDINEAFAVQTLACAKALNLDLAKLNVNGGAVALGHPLAASGSRITGHLTHEMRRKGLKRSIGAACIGGGQGIAVLLEAV